MAAAPPASTDAKPATNGKAPVAEFSKDQELAAYRDDAD